VIAALTQFGIQVIVDRLDVCDFMIADHGYERKTGRDFTASIKDGRLDGGAEDELLRAKFVYADVTLILEDFGTAFETQMNPDSIYGMESKIKASPANGGYGVGVAASFGIGGTARFLAAECRRLQKGPEDLPVKRSRPRLATLHEKQLYFLQGLTGVGPKRAELLLTQLKSPWAIISLIVQTGICYTKGGNPRFANETDLTGVDGIDTGFVIDNRLLMGVDSE
jgi:ERCC4-type nuclease